MFADAVRDGIGVCMSRNVYAAGCLGDEKRAEPGYVAGAQWQQGMRRGADIECKGMVPKEGRC